MSNGGRILSAERTLGEFSPDGYSIFDRGESNKDITLWQPGGTINDVSSLASPEHGMKNKAELFLERAKASGCQLAAGPELAYDINWVTDHTEYLFAEDSPLFILGCAPVRDDTREEVIETLKADFDVEEAGDIESNPDEFITPTIIPIKASFRQDSSSDAVLIQYKNHPMSDSVIPTEQANLVEGEAIWKIDPRNNPTVIAWTCSDVMDADLRERVQREARLNDTYVVHVQCNPDPFNETWIDFRNQAFDGSDHKVTYICSNWGNVRLDGDANWFGYSSVYTKARRRSPLDRYDTTYQNGGLVGTKPGYRCDFIWLMGEDTVCRVQFKRQNTGATGAGSPSFSLPRIYEAWPWDQESSSYTTDTPGVPECNEPVCDEWRSQLPESALSRELMTAITLGKIDFDPLPENGLNPETDFNWAALETLKDSDGAEKLGHVFVTHRRRTLPGAAEEAEQLVGALDQASALNISMDDQFDLQDAPMNAKFDDKPISICLTVLRGFGDSVEQRGAKQLYEWVTRRNDEQFKPIVATQDVEEGMVFKTLEGHEDISHIDYDPEKVSTTGGLVRLEQ